MSPDPIAEARRGCEGARDAWLVCTPAGRAKLAAYRKWVEEKAALGLSAHVRVSQVQYVLNAVKREAEAGKNDLYQDDEGRGAVDPHVLRIKISVFQNAVQVMQSAMESAKRARATLEVFRPAPSLLPENDGSVYYSAFVDATQQLTLAQRAAGVEDTPLAPPTFL